MTPNDIEILIHCHVSPAPHPRADATAVQGALMGLEAHGLIERGDGISYRTTERGKAHILQLCSLAFPTRIWTGASGEILDCDQ